MAPTTHIIVLTGTDPKLSVDYTVFDALSQKYGIGYTRMDGVKYQDFVEHMERIQIEGAGMPDVHISAHMSPEGAQFADKLVTPQELSIPLAGVNFLFLNGCQSTAIGDYLPGISDILTLMNDVSHRHAWQLARLVWSAKCNGYDVQEAYNYALQRLPGVAPYAYLHHRTDFLASKATI